MGSSALEIEKRQRTREMGREYFLRRSILQKCKAAKRTGPNNTKPTHIPERLEIIMEMTHRGKQAGYTHMVIRSVFGRTHTIAEKEPSVENRKPKTRMEVL